MKNAHAVLVDEHAKLNDIHGHLAEEHQEAIERLTELEGMNDSLASE